MLLVAVVLYYGLPLVRIYWNYYKLVDEMRTNARFAQTMNDEEMVRRLRLTVDELDLPDEAKRFVVRRTEFPSVVSIQTRYRQEIELPFHRRTIVFRPAVEARQ